MAVTAVAAMGATTPETHVSIERTMIPGSTTDLGLIEATITVESTGWPDSAG